MSVLLLGYASFIHYIDKAGYKSVTQGQGWISFWFGNEKAQNWQLIQDEMYCGYVITYRNTLNRVFHKHPSLIKELLKYSVKPIRDDHCFLPSSLWGVSTQIQSGETISCFRT